MTRFWRIIRPFRRVLSALVLILVPIVLLAGIGWGVVYVRLMNGPVSLSYLKPAIERQIAEKLGGLRVTVSDVVLSMVEHRAEFRLMDVRVRDDAGKLVAQAPLASMEINRMALFRGQVSPTGIVLIRPQMQLSYSETGGLALSFGQDGSAETGLTTNDGRGTDAVQPAVPSLPAAPGSPAVASLAGPDGAGATAVAGSITVMRSIAQLLGSLRDGLETGAATGQGTSVGSALSLDRIGVRNGLVEIEYGGRRSRWGVPSGDLELRRQGDQSSISGLATIAESEGQNIIFSFGADTSDASRKVTLRAAVRDLRPAALIRISPAFQGLQALETAFSAETILHLTEAGDVVTGDVTVEIGPGQLNVPAYLGTGAVALDNGRFAFQFGDKSSAIDIKPSSFRWGKGNELHFTGLVEPAGSGELAGVWGYKLTAQRGQLVSEPGSATRQPVTEWSSIGRLIPDQGQLLIDQALIAVGESRAAFKGALSMAGDGASSVEGTLGAGPLNALMYLWPTPLMADARLWAGQHVRGGKLEGGQFAFSTAEGSGASADGAGRQVLVLRGADVGIAAPIGNVPVFAPKALLQLTGSAFEISAPIAVAELGEDRRLTLKQVKFDVPDVGAVRLAGQLSMKVSGGLRDGVALLRRAPQAASISADLLKQVEQAASGRIDGRISIAMPLAGNPGANTQANIEVGEGPELTGKLAITDVRMRKAFAAYDLSGGSFQIDMAAKSVNASGSMLIEGVAAKLAWQYILDAPFESQPPIRLQANLDERDRDKLGIQINHFVRGIVDVEATIIPLSGGGVGAKISADATKAAISIESLAWVKPIGRRMQLEFDVVSGKTQPVTFENFQAVGDGIAIQGRAVLDAKYNLRSFELPLFSIDRVTRLAINGRLEKGNIWAVTVGGQTFEGRALFRSLFQAGGVPQAVSVPGAQQMGVDLTANIQTVLGFWNSSLSQVRLTLSKRAGKIETMQLEGQLEGDKLLKAAVLRAAGGRRELHAFSDDAGKALTLVGFYPNADRGRLELVVNLDARGRAEKSGVLLVRNFSIRGDEVVGELSRTPSDGMQRRRARSGVGVQSSGGQALSFDWMRVPFFIGNGQFILQGAELRGPVVGATIEGKADFGGRTLDLSGTYVPLQGLNGALGVIPGLGQILAGPNGEGVLGMKFAVRGPMSEPEMLVNPLSIMAPGIFREMFQASSPSLEVTPPTQMEAQDQRARPSANGRSQRGNWRRGVFEAK